MTLQNVIVIQGATGAGSITLADARAHLHVDLQSTRPLMSLPMSMDRRIA
jgi:hypothetical protein